MAVAFVAVVVIVFLAVSFVLLLVAVRILTGRKRDGGGGNSL
jgi:hypothetical protein